MKTVALKCRLKAGKQIVGAGCAETLRQFWMSRRAGRRRGERSSQLCRGRGGVPALYVPSWGGRSLPACRRRASIYYGAGSRQLSGKIKVFQINKLTSIHPNCELVKLCFVFVFWNLFVLCNQHNYCLMAFYRLYCCVFSNRVSAD